MEQNQNSMQLILGGKYFTISSKFHYLNDVNQQILNILLTQHQYEVKSNVDDHVLQSFINYWVNRQIPDIKINNIYQYDQLSCEFDLMKDLIELSKKEFLKSKLSLPLHIQNHELKKEIREKNDIFTENLKKYFQTIRFLIDENQIGSYSKFLEIKDELYDAIDQENINMVNFLTRKKVKVNGFTFILNEDEQTSEILNFKNQMNKIVIPKSVYYKSKEYKITALIEKSFQNSQIKSLKFADDSELKFIDNRTFSFSLVEKITFPSHVTCISSNAFSFCSHLKKVKFLENSELTFIGEYAFSNSSVEMIAIPSSVTEFGENWCHSTPKLSRIKIIQNEEQNISLYEDKLIIGKSHRKSDTFDILLFACRDIETVTIPSFIKKIASSAFDKCNKLQTINFSEDSQLEYISQYAFSGTSIEIISIPRHVKQIDKCAFYSCTHLKKIEFSENSELRTIKSFAFSMASSIENISIPSSVVDLEEEWCSFMPSLVDVRMKPGNDCFLNFENGFLIGKSVYFSDVFDVLLFARRNIKKAVIPSFVKRIGSFSVEKCLSLFDLEFSFDSQLESIGKNAFSFSSIEKIEIPSSLKRIDESAFYKCNRLCKVDISENSQLETIGEIAFSFTKIASFFIPSKIKSIDIKAFSNCKCLNIVEIDENSKLKSIDREMFFHSNFDVLMVPTKLDKKLKII